MTTRADHLQALAYLCRDFGGRLAVVSQREFDRLFDDGDSEATPWDEDELSAAPFTSAHGLWWKRKIVYAVEGREEVGSILHEMGHVFACAHHPHHPQCREWSWFGWELAIARRIGAARTWSRHNATYLVSEGGNDSWQSRTPRQKRLIVGERLAHARWLGLLDETGAPLSLR